MKTYLLFFFSLLMLAQSQAQNFAPVGAKWHYSHQYSNSVSNTGYIKLEVIKDSTINNIEVRVIKISSNNNSLISYEYIAQQNDSVLYYNQPMNNFYLLYNFAAQEGDTIIVHPSNAKTPSGFLDYSSNDSIQKFGYVITKLDSIQIENKWYKQQHVADLFQGSSNWCLSGFANPSAVIVPVFGASSYLFGLTRNITPETVSPILRCYQDSVTNYKKSNWDKDCDYQINWQLVKNETLKSSEYKLYPNPCQNKLYIELPTNLTQNLNYQITDIFGSTQLQGILNNKAIDIDTLKNGLYFIGIFHNDVLLFKTKFVKQ